jgi:hypothetical protein
MGCESVRSAELVLGSVPVEGDDDRVAPASVLVNLDHSKHDIGLSVSNRESDVLARLELSVDAGALAESLGGGRLGQKQVLRLLQRLGPLSAVPRVPSRKLSWVIDHSQRPGTRLGIDVPDLVLRHRECEPEVAGVVTGVGYPVLADEPGGRF